MKVYGIGYHDSPEERRVADVATSMQDAVAKAKLLTDELDWKLEDGEAIASVVIEKDYCKGDILVSFRGDQGTHINWFVREYETDLPQKVVIE